MAGPASWSDRLGGTMGAETDAASPPSASVQGKRSLPDRGVGAHRGGPQHGPENTLEAFRRADALGVHQIEFDVRRTQDGEIVVIHDASVDRTTNGCGKVEELCLEEVRRLDAGSGERIPTLSEALCTLPGDVWINIQIKRGEPIAAAVALRVIEAGRADQVLLACGNAAGRAAMGVHSGLRICNLARQQTRAAYLDHAVAVGSSFIQFHYLRGRVEPEIVERAHREGLSVNFVCAPKPSDHELLALFDAGVDFILVDDLDQGLEVAARLGIAPLSRGDDPLGSAASLASAPASPGRGDQQSE